MPGSKRPAHPTFADLGARKRQRATLATAGGAGRKSTMANLSDELWLCILGLLDFSSLAAVERVDRHFMRLSNDGQLWKSLYLGLDLTRSSGGGAGANTRAPLLGREVAALPPKAASLGQSEDVIDYKYLYRVWTNFSNGRSVLTSLPSTPTIERALPASVKLEVGLPALLPPPATGRTTRPAPTTLLVLASPYLVTFSTLAIEGNPSGSVFRAKAGAGSLATFQAGDALSTFTSAGLGCERQRRPPKINIRPTDIALDARGWVTDDELLKRGRSIGLYVGWSSGAFSLFSLREPAASSSQVVAVTVEEVFFQPSPTIPPLHPVVGSALYGPLLVTCSDHFRLSFFHLPKTAAGPDAGPTAAVKPREATKELRPFRSLRSLTSWHPSTLRLAACPSSSAPDAVKLAIAYAVPCYPDLFSVARQEVVLRPSKSTLGGARWDWLEDRSLSALAPVGLGAFWQAPSKTPAADGESTTELGTVGRVSAVAQDDRWVCLAGEDNVVQLFEVPDAPGATRLEWRQTLWAHSAGVTAVSVRNGRCVTADSTGRLLIWDLGQLDRPRPTLPCPIEPSALPSPPSTPLRASTSATRSSAVWVEVLTPRHPTSPPLPTSAAAGNSPSTATIRDESDMWTDLHAANTGRGSERIQLVVQDDERIVSVGVPREAGAGDDDFAGRVKVWAFDG